MKFPNPKDLPKMIVAQWKQPEKRFPFIAALLSFSLTVGSGFGFMFALLTVTGITGATYLATMTVQYFLKETAKLEETRKATDLLNAKHQQELAAFTERNKAFGQLLQEGKAAIDTTVAEFNQKMVNKLEKMQSLEESIEEKIQNFIEIEKNIHNTAYLEIRQSHQEFQSKALEEFKSITQDLYNKYLTDIYTMNKHHEQNIDKFNQELHDIQDGTLPTIRSTLEAQGKMQNNLCKAIGDLQKSNKAVEATHKNMEEKINTALGDQNKYVKSKVKKVNKNIEMLAKRIETVAIQVVDLKESATQVKEVAKRLKNQSSQFEEHMNNLNSDVEQVKQKTQWCFRSQWDPKGGIKSLQSKNGKKSANGLKVGNGLNNTNQMDIDELTEEYALMEHEDNERIKVLLNTFEIESVNEKVSLMPQPVYRFYDPEPLIPTFDINISLNQPSPLLPGFTSKPNTNKFQETAAESPNSWNFVTRTNWTRDDLTRKKI